MDKGTTQFRGVILSARQIVTVDDNKRRHANLELTFKVLQKKVEREVTNESGEKTTKIEWVDTLLPMFKQDGTAYEAAKITLSNAAFCALPIVEDKNISKNVKKRFVKLCAETENRPMSKYANVSEFAKYILEGRGVIFTRDLYHVGDKFYTSNGIIECDKECYQNIVSMLAGTMQDIFAELCEEWRGVEYPVIEPTTPTTTATQSEPTAMFANL